MDPKRLTTELRRSKAEAVQAESTTTREDGKVIMAASGSGDSGDARERHITQEERRIDPADGCSYTKLQFIAFYGDTREWDAIEAASLERASAVGPGNLEASSMPV